MPYRYKGVNFHWNAQLRIRTNLHLAEPTQASLIDRWATSRPSSPLRANCMSPLVYLQCETNKLERCFSLADGATTWSKWDFYLYFDGCTHKKHSQNTLKPENATWTTLRKRCVDAVPIQRSELPLECTAPNPNEFAPRGADASVAY